MADIGNDLEQRRQRRRTAPPDERRERVAAAPVRHLALAATTPPSRGDWANELTALVQNELRTAARGGVINDGECEQLLARLVLVIDQALSTE